MNILQGQKIQIGLLGKKNWQWTELKQKNRNNINYVVVFTRKKYLKQ